MNDAKISGLYNPSGNFKFSTSSKILDLLNPSGNGIDLVNLIFIIVGILFFFNLIAAGWDYMLSSGDTKKTAVASTKITNGLAGIIMVFTAYLVVKLISSLLGLGVKI